MKNCISQVNNEKGVALLIAMMMLIMMTLIGIAAIMTSTTDINIAKNVKNSSNSLFQAEAGIEEVKVRMVDSSVAQLAVDPFNGFNINWVDYLTTSSAATTVQFNSAASPYYDVTFNANGSNNIYASVQNQSQWQWVKIQHKKDSTGTMRCYQPDTNPPSDVPCVAGLRPIEQVTALVNANGTYKMVRNEIFPIVNALNNRAVSLVGGLEMNGNATTGTYTSTTVGGPPTTAPNPNACVNSAMGGVQSNTTGAGSISISGAANNICGNLNYGVGGTSSVISVSGGSTPNIQGTKGPASANINFPPVNYPGTCATPTHGGAAFATTGDNKLVAGTFTVDTAAGNCYIIPKWDIQQNTQIYFPPGATLYFTNELELSGSNTILGTTQGTTPLQIKGLPTATEVEVKSGATLFGAVYAPSAEAEVESGGKIFGALTANSLEMGGDGTAGGVYYDPTQSTGTGTVTGWNNWNWNQLQ
ncbi:MAG: hypothetical protein HY036_05455 [Nitrospirae bacterium]|nr:hypothetical protein [Nitrospirota bacterium]